MLGLATMPVIGEERLSSEAARRRKKSDSESSASPPLVGVDVVIPVEKPLVLHSPWATPGGKVEF